MTNHAELRRSRCRVSGTAHPCRRHTIQRDVAARCNVRVHISGGQVQRESFVRAHIPPFCSRFCSRFHDIG